MYKRQIAYRYRLVSKVSGIVLAGLSAAGFAFTENIIYYARAIVFTSTTISAGDPDQAINTLVMLRGVWLAFGHPLFTTMTGIGVLVAVRTHSKVVRVLAPLVGYLAASVSYTHLDVYKRQCQCTPGEGADQSAEPHHGHHGRGFGDGRAQRAGSQRQQRDDGAETDHGDERRQVGGDGQTAPLRSRQSVGFHPGDATPGTPTRSSRSGWPYNRAHRPS